MKNIILVPELSLQRAKALADVTNSQTPTIIVESRHFLIGNWQPTTTKICQAFSYLQFSFFFFIS